MCNLVIFRSASVVVLNLLSPGNLYKYVSVLPKYDAEQFAPGMDVIETGTESVTGTEIETEIEIEIVIVKDAIVNRIDRTEIEKRRGVIGMMTRGEKRDTTSLTSYLCCSMFIYCAGNSS